MSMRKLVFAVVSLAGLCYGRRGQATLGQLQKVSSREEKSLADMFLLSFQPAKNLKRATSPSMGQAKDIKNKKVMEIDGDLFKVVEFMHTKTARQAGMVRTKLKNMISGATIEKTFRLTDTFNDVVLDNVDMSLSYIDGEEHVFMNMETYEETRLRSANLDGAEFLQGGENIQVQYWGDKAIDVRLPDSVTLEVTDAGNEMRDTSRSVAAKKTVTVEGGGQVSGVPEFVKAGDFIILDPSTGEFKKRTGGKDFN